MTHLNRYLLLLLFLPSMACQPSAHSDSPTPVTEPATDTLVDSATPQPTPSDAGSAAVAADSQNDSTPSNENTEMAQNPLLNVGDAAPSWTAESDTRGSISSESLKGSKYILYFYPKDMTQGCTIQAVDFTTLADQFNAKGYAVYGISGDSLESHQQFRNNYDINYDLLSDPDHSIAKSYGVWREKTSYGKKSIGLVRSTFVVDENGNLSHIYDNVRATGHAERLLNSL